MGDQAAVAVGRIPGGDWVAEMVHPIAAEVVDPIVDVVVVARVVVRRIVGVLVEIRDCIGVGVVRGCMQMRIAKRVVGVEVVVRPHRNCKIRGGEEGAVGNHCCFALRRMIVAATCTVVEMVVLSLGILA